MFLRVIRSLSPRSLVVILFFAAACGTASAQKIALIFQNTTAPYAALGAPIGYVLDVSNMGVGTIKVNDSITLTAPDNTVYTIYSDTPTIFAGDTSQRVGTFTSSTLTSQTGAFTLTATVTNLVGDVLASFTIPVTIVAVPLNGIYVSIGGQGPEAQKVGYTYDFETVTANLSASSQTLRTQPNLILTDGTVVGLDAGKKTLIAPGASMTSSFIVNTSQYSSIAGTYGLRVDVYDSSNNVLASDTHNFTRNAIPPGTYVPKFTDKASLNGMIATRLQPPPPPGCGNFPDFIMGGAGGAVGDYDGDGNDDIFAVDNNTGIGHLWHNNGDGTFTDVISTSRIPVIPFESGANFADIDNDGRPDLLIVVFNGRNVLLHNNGDGTFTDISANSGLNSNPVVQNSQSATFGDYDGDGFLDLYIGVHADCKASNQNDHLFHNNGNSTFTDVTSLLGGSTASQVNGRALAVMFVDYNQDGRPDIYVANDEGIRPWSHPNVLWQNGGPDGHGGWIFTDVSASTGANASMSAMGIGVSDYNRTGRYNLFITNYGANVLLQQDADGTFTQQQFDGFGAAHVSRGSFPSPTPGVINGSCPNGYTCPAIMWGTAFYDFNDDGWEDLYMSGGNTRAGNLIYPNAFFLNNQDGTFLDLSSISGTTNTTQGMMPTALFGDFNNDGFEDFFQWGLIKSPQLFINNARANGNPYNWLEVKLVGTTSNHDAVGTRLVANVGGVNLLRYVYNGGTYEGNSSLVQHFGLGSAVKVTSLIITWPSGKVTTLTNVPVNQKLTVIER